MFKQKKTNKCVLFPGCPGFTHAFGTLNPSSQSKIGAFLFTFVHYDSDLRVHFSLSVGEYNPLSADHILVYSDNKIIIGACVRVLHMARFNHRFYFSLYVSKTNF